MKIAATMPDDISGVAKDVREEGERPRSSQWPFEGNCYPSAVNQRDGDHLRYEWM